MPELLSSLEKAWPMPSGKNTLTKKKRCYIDIRCHNITVFMKRGICGDNDSL